jgi:hypothetical protein
MRRNRWTLVWFAVLAGYAAWLGSRFSPEPGGADASGYLNSAKFLAEGRLVSQLQMAPVLKDEWSQDFQPLGFEAIRHTTRLVPGYPVGLPLHLAAASSVFGWRWSSQIVGIGGALAAVGMCYRLARELGLTPLAAFATGAALALCAVFEFTSMQPLSDTLATFWCTTAVWLALRARRGAVGWSALGGVAFAVAVLVRPSNVLLLPVLVMLLPDGRKLTVAACAALPFAIALGLYQNHLYGSPLRSGYGDVSGLFSTAYFWPTMRHFTVWVSRLVPLGMVGLLISPLLLRGPRRREVAALLLWAAVFIGFYAVYDFSRQDWTFLRFIEPAFPALLVLGGLGLDQIAARLAVAGWPRAAGWIAIGIVGLTLATNVTFKIPDARKHDRMYAEARTWVRDNLPADAPVVCMQFSGVAYFDDGHPILRWDIVGATAAEGAKYLTALHRAGQPVFAVLDAAELADFGSASAWKITPAGNQ